MSTQPEVIAQLSSAELDRLFDPQQALGLAEVFVEHVLAAHRARA